MMQGNSLIFPYFAAFISFLAIVNAAKSDVFKKSNAVRDVLVQEQSSNSLVQIQLYMESQCPKTTAFLNEQLVPVFAEFHSNMNLTIIPFGKANFTKLDTPAEDYSFECQHGPDECFGNQLMSCAIKKLKDVDKYLPYIVCVQQTKPNSTEQQACDEKFELPHAEMQECANDTEGRSLHHEMGVLTQQIEFPAEPFPWVVIDGVVNGTANTQLKQVIMETLGSFGAKAIPNYATLLCVMGAFMLSLYA